MSAAREFRGGWGVGASGIKVEGCDCPIMHVGLSAPGCMWSVVLTPEDATALVAWLERPADAITLRNTAGPSGDDFSSLYLQVVPTLEGERHVALTFRAPTEAPDGVAVRLPLETARVVAAYVRELLSGVPAAPTPKRAILAGVSVPESYALQLTLRGDELRWLSHALSALGSVLAEVDPRIAGVSRELLAANMTRELQHYAPAATSFFTSAGAVYAVLEEAAAQLRAEGKIP